MLDLMGRPVIMPRRAAQGQPPLWLMGPQEPHRMGESLNAERYWTEHRHNNTVLHYETSEGFGAWRTWVQILDQPLGVLVVLGKLLEP